VEETQTAPEQEIPLPDGEGFKEWFDSFSDFFGFPFG